jgi:hypothetical protein
MIQIACVNLSKNLSDADLTAYAAAYEIQANRDLRHGMHQAKVTAYPTGTKAPLGSWVLGFFDNADIANALGYHDVTPDDLPLGKVFVETTLSVGDKVSVTGSHELIEMLGDPMINLAAQVGDSIFYAFELCDACEDDSFGYDIDGVTVSDFVTESWFVVGSPGPYDFRGHIERPLQLLPGGYISVLQLGAGAGWSQIDADKKNKSARSIALTQSRRDLRTRGRTNRVKSTY